MKRLQVLAEEQLQQMHEATLSMLSETGVKLTHSGARELLLEHGATTDGERVLLPPDLVEKRLGQCPHTVRLQGRDPERAVELGRGDW